MCIIFQRIFKVTQLKRRIMDSNHPRGKLLARLPIEDK